MMIVTRFDAQPAAVRFLTEEGLRPGSDVTLRGIGTYGSLLVEVEKGYVELSADIARLILISQPTITH
jgi:Fe2+ transport system protein FeoA